jgi:anaerobic magnesium-protoporphyrin IX monomethyl ester cyclase
MKKVLLLNLPGKKPYLRDYYCSLVSKGDFIWHPIDLTVLSGVLNQDFEVEVIDALAQKIDFSDCLQRILKISPDAIIFLSGAVSWEEDKKFLKGIKKDVTLIGTGDIFLFKGEDLIKENDFLNAVILDFTSFDIIDFLKNKERNFKSLIYRKGNKIIMNKKNADNEEDFFLPLPRLDLFPLKRYHCPVVKDFPFATVIASLNCPFHCHFCTYGNLKFKLRKVKNVIEELKYIKSIGIKEVRFKDNTFGADRNQLLGICNGMIENKLNFKWSCSSRVDGFDEKLLRLMKKSGCHTIQFGVESGNQEILDLYNKGFNLEQVRNTFSLCKKNGIRTMGHFILGLPGEDKKMVIRTINFSKNLNCDFAAFNIASPRIGSDLRKIAKRKGWLKSFDLSKTDSSLIYPVLETEKLSQGELWNLRNRAIREFYFNPSYIFKKIFLLSSFGELKILTKQAFLLFISMFKK